MGRISPNVRIKNVITPIAMTTPCNLPKKSIAREVATAEAAIFTILFQTDTVVTTASGSPANLSILSAPFTPRFNKARALSLPIPISAISEPEKNPDMTNSTNRSKSFAISHSDTSFLFPSNYNV